MFKIPGVLLCCAMFSLQVCAQARKDTTQFDLRIDGSQKFQPIDGIGVNVNTRSWNGTELQEAIELLHDSMNAAVWRVLAETVEKWEEENDDDDPFHFNWAYYDKLYETPKFQKVWDMVAYLNKRGITDKLMINFMGVVPKWMGEEVVKPEFEDEYIEMIVSFFYYGIKKKNLRISLISHMNEPDIRKEGPTVKPLQYASIFSKFIKRMQQVGLGDVRYVGPDVAGMNDGINNYMPEMMKDTTIMNNLAYIGLHSYAGSYAPVDSTINKSPYPEMNYWITEWNEWCNGCDDGKIGTYDYNYARKSVRHLIDLIENGASSCMVWEGYDSYYEHHAPSPFSYWGVLKFNKDSRTYTPRKHFYTISQVSRYLLPGSVRIGTTPSIDDFFVIAVQDSLKRVNILGVNLNNTPVHLNASLKNLQKIKGFRMSHTNESVNFETDADVKTRGGKLKATIPANSVFALTSY